MTIADTTLIAQERPRRAPAKGPAVDPVTVEIIRNALNAAADEMSVNLGRSAYTPIIYEVKDYSVALFDEGCQLLGQAPGLPIFLGALEDAIRVTLRRYSLDQMRPGDVYLVNDSYLVGSHLNDISLFSPVFHGGALIGFAATKAHWIDIGSKDPSQTMSSTNIYQEGYRIGPTRIMRRGRLNEELLDIFMINSRMPHSIRGDFFAMVAACRTGEQRLQALHERFAKDVIDAAVTEIFRQCEQEDREVIETLPDGRWESAGYMDSDGNGSDPVLVKLAVTISGSEIHLDLDGSASQTGGCLNSGFAQTVSAARLAFKFLVNPETAATGGTFRCLRVTAPEGSIFAAKEPAACQYYYPHAGLMIDLFITLMAEALPDQVTAAQCADPMNVMFDGVNPDTRGAVDVRGGDRDRLGRLPGPGRRERTGQLRRRRPEELPGRGTGVQAPDPDRLLRAAARLRRGRAAARRTGHRPRLHRAGRQLAVAVAGAHGHRALGHLRRPAGRHRLGRAAAAGRDHPDPAQDQPHRLPGLAAGSG